MTAPSPTITCLVGTSIADRSLTSNVAEITTVDDHGLTVGSIVTIAGAASPFNGTGRVITEVPTSKKFRFALVNADIAAAGAGGTVQPTTIVLTEDVPTVPVVCTDTATHDPAASARAWRIGSTAIPNGTSAAETLSFRRAGTYQVNVNVTNADGTAASSNTQVTVVDNIATANGTPETVDGSNRVPPHKLPDVYRDPRYATPGLPTATDLAAAKAYGTITDTPLAATTMT